MSYHLPRTVYVGIFLLFVLLSDCVIPTDDYISNGETIKILFQLQVNKFGLHTSQSLSIFYIYCHIFYTINFYWISTFCLYFLLPSLKKFVLNQKHVSLGSLAWKLIIFSVLNVFSYNEHCIMHYKLFSFYILYIQLYIYIRVCVYIYVSIHTHTHTRILLSIHRSNTLRAAFLHSYWFLLCALL